MGLALATQLRKRAPRGGAAAVGAMRARPVAGRRPARVANKITHPEDALDGRPLWRHIMVELQHRAQHQQPDRDREQHRGDAKADGVAAHLLDRRHHECRNEAAQVDHEVEPDRFRGFWREAGSLRVGGVVEGCGLTGPSPLGEPQARLAEAALGERGLTRGMLHTRKLADPQLGASEARGAAKRWHAGAQELARLLVAQHHGVAQPRHPEPRALRAEGLRQRAPVEIGGAEAPLAGRALVELVATKGTDCVASGGNMRRGWLVKPCEDWLVAAVYHELNPAVSAAAGGLLYMRTAGLDAARAQGDQVPAAPRCGVAAFAWGFSVDAGSICGIVEMPETEGLQLRLQLRPPRLIVAAKLAPPGRAPIAPHPCARSHEDPKHGRGGAVAAAGGRRVVLRLERRHDVDGGDADQAGKVHRAEYEDDPKPRCKSGSIGRRRAAMSVAGQAGAGIMHEIAEALGPQGRARDMTASWAARPTPAQVRVCQVSAEQGRHKHGALEHLKQLAGAGRRVALQRRRRHAAR